jgi:pilus assembly protein CpaE
MSSSAPFGAGVATTLDGPFTDRQTAWVPGDTRVPLMAFVRDAASETVLRDSLFDATPETFEIRRGGIRAAINELQKTGGPRYLIVDVGGEEQPLIALAELAQVVEPDVQVLVIGDLTDLDFYREVTRGLGAREYLPKPITRDRVIRLFAPVVVGQPLATQEVNGGRVVAVTGARGGVGATTIAANLAWHFGVSRNRHTVLLDPNLHTGSAALYIDSSPGPGLRAALEMPDRIDDLFIERAATVMKDRLHVLAGQEPLAQLPTCAPDAAPRLLGALRRRYNFIVVDVPFQPVPLYRDLLELADQRVIILEPMLAGVRDALRLRALYASTAQAPTVMVLNRDGMPGGMTVEQVESALETKLDLVIPDLPARLAKAANIGSPAVTGRGFFTLRIQEIARLVAHNRLVGAETGPAAPPVKRKRERRGSWRTLFGKRA